MGSVASRVLEKPFISASSNMTIAQLIAYLIPEKKRHDEVLAGLCGLDNVPMGVWNDYTKAECVDREDGMAGESDENNARIVVNGQRVRTDYRFDFEIWTMCNDVPVRMEPTFRLWEVA